MSTERAIKELKKIGAPVYEHLMGEHGCEFIIGAELRDSKDHYYAEYYQEEIKEKIVNGKVINAFGILESVHEILKKNNLWCEWINPGQLGVYKF